MLENVAVALFLRDMLLEFLHGDYSVRDHIDSVSSLGYCQAPIRAKQCTSRTSGISVVPGDSSEDRCFHGEVVWVHQENSSYQDACCVLAGVHEIWFLKKGNNVHEMRYLHVIRCPWLIVVHALLHAGTGSALDRLSGRTRPGSGSAPLWIRVSRTGR